MKYLVEVDGVLQLPSLSLRRAWIEIASRIQRMRRVLSLSLRRAWIEICNALSFSLTFVTSLSLRRAWIEIGCPGCEFPECRRSPYGERGLKYLVEVDGVLQLPSLSLRRAWIEIASRIQRMRRVLSLSLRRAWIEICNALSFSLTFVTSLSLRRAWIEIMSAIGRWTWNTVALLTESVD